MHATQPSKPGARDSLFASTRDDNLGEQSQKARAETQEMTTGWQFATQIEDDEENRFEIHGDSRGPTTQSALLIANRDVFPSMLDPAFEDDPPTPGRAAEDKPDRGLAPLSRGAAEQKAKL